MENRAWFTASVTGVRSVDENFSLKAANCSMPVKTTKLRSLRSFKEIQQNFHLFSIKLTNVRMWSIMVIL